MKSSADQITTARGVKAGKWVCLEKDYKEDCRQSRATNGRNSVPPFVTYRLAVATFPLNGNQQVVNFANGQSVTWHSASNVIFTECGQLKAWNWDIYDEDLSQVAEGLTYLIEFLYDNSKPVPQQDIFQKFGSENEFIVSRAIEIAQWWNFVTIEFAANASYPEEARISLTEAGRGWHYAVAAPSIPRTGGKSMRNSREPDRSIHIGTVSGNLIYAGNNISGSPSANVYNTQLSDDQVLTYLEALLSMREIPWANPDLTGVRRVIEEALRQQNPHMSGLRRAINRIGSVCEQVAIGVLSNGTYQVLLQHFR